MGKGFNHAPKYAQFIKQRDAALDKLHSKAQTKAADELKVALKRIETIVRATITHLPNEMQFSHADSMLAQHLGSQIDFELNEYKSKLVQIVTRLRRSAATMALLGELEAISRVTGKQVTVNKKRVDVVKPYVEHPYGGTIESHFSMALKKLRDKIVNAVVLGKIRGDETELVLDMVRKQYPKFKRYKRPPRQLKPIREAERKPVETFVFGTFPEEDVQDMLADYAEEYVPKFRSDAVFDVEGDAGFSIDEGEWAQWEVENQITSDFVDLVRDKQIQAASDQGITDFVWITVFGPNTCDSCKWRNGLTTSEIEAKLEQVDDDIDATNPPAHPHCYCTLAPYSEAGFEGFDAPESLGDFETWLEKPIKLL